MTKKTEQIEFIGLGNKELCGIARETYEDYPDALKVAITEEMNEYRYFDFPLKIRWKFGIKGIYLILAFGHDLQLWDQYGDKTHYSRILIPNAHTLAEYFSEIVNSWRN